MYVRYLKYMKPFRKILNVKYIVAIWILFFVLLYGFVGAYFLRDQFKPPIQTRIQAFYFSVMTATTVGYGDFVPTTDQARLFTISLVILAAGTFFSVVFIIFRHMVLKFEKKRARYKSNF